MELISLPTHCPPTTTPCTTHLDGELIGLPAVKSVLVAGQLNLVSAPPILTYTHHTLYRGRGLGSRVQSLQSRVYILTYTHTYRGRGLGALVQGLGSREPRAWGFTLYVSSLTVGTLVSGDTSPIVIVYNIV